MASLGLKQKEKKMDISKAMFIKVKQVSGKEKWVNPWNISTVTNDLSKVTLKMTNNELVEFDYNEKENQQLLNYMQLWAPPPKEVL